MAAGDVWIMLLSSQVGKPGEQSFLRNPRKKIDAPGSERGKKIYREGKWVICNAIWRFPPSPSSSNWLDREWNLKTSGWKGEDWMRKSQLVLVLTGHWFLGHCQCPGGISVCFCFFFLIYTSRADIDFLKWDIKFRFGKNVMPVY